MENKMTYSYEYILILSGKIGEEKTTELNTKFKDLIEAEGEIINIAKWGKKKFAYPIEKETEGEYIIFAFKSSTEFPKELIRISNITDGVLRAMVVKKEIEKKKSNVAPKKEVVLEETPKEVTEKVAE